MFITQSSKQRQSINIVKVAFGNNQVYGLIMFDSVNKVETAFERNNMVIITEFIGEIVVDFLILANKSYGFHAFI
jgi:hypothetical protein